MATLSDGQLLALRNLGRKQAGEIVSWINIADARHLTDLGLATRGREGWNLTAAGAAALAALGPGETAEPKNATTPWPIRPTPPEAE